MTDLDALLAGIVADPLEETRWLVLADWLEENDDPRRAEFLRLHRLMLATCCEPDAHPDRAQWQSRMTELLIAGVKPCVPQETLTLPGGVPMTFSFIPPGAFLMGLNVNFPDKNPREVTLTKGFHLGVFAVTQAQWQAVMGNNPSNFGGDDHPVETVSWDDCQDFCERLTNHLAGRGRVRLPTAAEWELACRAGTTTWHYVADRLQSQRASWFSEYDAMQPEVRRCHEQLKLAAWFKFNSGETTHPVGQLLPNAWGLYDMTGNVWQWCSDWWGHYSPEQLIDPIASAGDVSRVYRGGSWGGPGGFCWTNSRSGNVPSTRDDFIGLRVCFHPV